jgi:anti-sigma regulatory factor (Ser/Thr protein kinase)
VAPKQEPRSRSTVLRAGPTTASEARWFLAEALDSLGVDTDRSTATLLTSEVASNAARHGREPIDVTVWDEEGFLRVSVFDRGEGFDPVELSSEPMSEGGWGLRIVQNLASEWGVHRQDEGVEVWFRL